MTASGRDGNKLLCALSPQVLQRLQARTRRVDAREILFGFHQRSPDVFFPHPGTVMSLIYEVEEGQIEIGLIGPEGFADLQMLLGPDASSAVAIVEMGGEVSCVDALRLRAELGNDVNTRDLMLGYAALYIEQLILGVVCNNMHSIQQRLAKWLLIVRDHSGRDELQLSHEFLANTLGCQRSGITLAIGALSDDGLIHHSRKLITVDDAIGLAERACACHQSMLGRLNTYRARLYDTQYRSLEGGHHGRSAYRS